MQNLVIIYREKGSERESLSNHIYIYVYKNQSLFFTPETNTKLQINYIKKKTLQKEILFLLHFKFN